MSSQDKKSKKKDDSQYYDIKRSIDIKLKDKLGRNFVKIDFMKSFGFVPETIIIEKVKGQHDKIFVMCLLTKEQKEKEERQMKSVEKQLVKASKEYEASKKKEK
jgi:hypothetical protein